VPNVVSYPSPCSKAEVFCPSGLEALCDVCLSHYSISRNLEDSEHQVAENQRGVECVLGRFSSLIHKQKQYCVMTPDSAVTLFVVNIQ